MNFLFLAVIEEHIRREFTSLSHTYCGVRSEQTSCNGSAPEQRWHYLTQYTADAVEASQPTLGLGGEGNFADQGLPAYGLFQQGGFPPIKQLKIDDPCLSNKYGRAKLQISRGRWRLPPPTVPPSTVPPSTVPPSTVPPSNIQSHGNECLANIHT